MTCREAFDCYFISLGKLSIKVYLPQNHFIKEESLSTDDYLSYFYPFDDLDFRKSGMESGWFVTDRENIAIAMAMGNAPQAVHSLLVMVQMCFSFMLTDKDRDMHMCKHC